MHFLKIRVFEEFTTVENCCKEPNINWDIPMQSLGVFIGNVNLRIGVAFTFPAITHPFLDQSSKSWCLLKTRD